MLKDIKNNDIKYDRINWFTRNRQGVANLKILEMLITQIEFHKIFP